MRWEGLGWILSSLGNEPRRRAPAEEERKVLGPAAMPRHEALKKLAAYILAFTRVEPAQTTVIRTYADLGGLSPA
jgi:hypothetical protein